MSIETQIRAVGILAFVFILYSLWMGQMKAPGLPGGYSSPVLALELARNGTDIDGINRFENGKAAQFIKKHLPKDFGYIAIYVVLFSCLALLLAELGVDWTRYAALSAVVCIVIAGVFDVIENLGMLKAVSTPVGTATDSLANLIRYPSLAKWASLFIFCLLIGLAFSKRPGWLLIPGVTFLISGVLGLTGVVLNLVSPKSYWMFSASVVSLGIAIICVAISFTFWPTKVLNRFFADF